MALGSDVLSRAFPCLFLIMRKIMLDRREGFLVESRCQSIMADSHKGVYHDKGLCKESTASRQSFYTLVSQFGCTIFYDNSPSLRPRTIWAERVTGKIFKSTRLTTDHTEKDPLGWPPRGFFIVCYLYPFPSTCNPHAWHTSCLAYNVHSVSF